MKDYSVRLAQEEDINKIYILYKKVAAQFGGLARVENEITLDYILYFSKKAKENGVQFIITAGDDVVGEIHCHKLQPSVFQHVLSELTIAICPSVQGKGLGKRLFQTLLNHIVEHRKDILRVELIARESNEKAIKLYESLGFRREGRFENRILTEKGCFEADIPMAWLNPCFLQHNSDIKLD